MPGPADNTHALNRPRWSVGVAALVLLTAIVLAYANSLSAPFVYDDRPSIVYNGTIRDLTAWRQLLHPPGGGATVSGRPVLNVSFALDYAWCGLDVRGYHVTNILIHAGVALALFGLIRRTLARGAGAWRQRALPVALAVAGVWALDPLHTEAVTYVVQRAESLMSLWFVLTLYAFARSFDSARPRAWRRAAWIACVLGMGTKENMAVAPVVVLLYDRAFVAGSIAAAWRQRRAFHVALALTWIPLALLVISTGGNRGGSAGFDVGVGAVSYWLTQLPALVRYAALIVWPAPLVFDYGAFFVTDAARLVFPALWVIALLAAGGYALWRRPAAGFLVAVAFGILAPTSLVPGTAQMIVEHRLYLPLAAVLALAIPLAVRCRPRALATAAIGVALAFGALTAARNRVYRSELALWQDTAVKRPDSAVAHSSLGAALKNAGQPDAAIAEHRRALHLNPNYAPALTNLGIALAETGRPDEALPYVSRAVTFQPDNAQAQLNLGVTLDLLHRSAEALPHYATAERLMPVLPSAQNDYGDALCRAGDLVAGTQHLRRAIELEPTYAEAYFNLAAALVRQDRMTDALATFAQGAALRPGDGSAHLTWANFLVRHGHLAEALAEYRAALALTPDAADVHYSYATALSTAHDYDAALREYRAALKLKPDYAEAHNNLGNTLLALNRPADAIPEYEQALRSRPNDARTHNNLGLALAQSGRLREAAEHFSAAVRFAPDFQNARDNLEHAQAQLRQP